TRDPSAHCRSGAWLWGACSCSGRWALWKENTMLRRICFALFLMALAESLPLFAQTATLSGTVVDPSGAAIPGAKATVATTETGIQRTVQTDDRGRFTIPQLAPGSYQLSVTQQGFETLVRSGIMLVIGQEALVNLTMTVGSVTEQVTVTGEAPL